MMKIKNFLIGYFGFITNKVKVRFLKELYRSMDKGGDIFLCDAMRKIGVDGIHTRKLLNSLGLVRACKEDGGIDGAIFTHINIPENINSSVRYKDWKLKLINMAISYHEKKN